MASPFSLFRKNQKTLMVVLTGLAMFAFVLLGNADPNAPGSSLVFAIMLICAAAGIGWALGFRQEKGTEYATTGAIAAIAAAVVLWFFAGPEPYVTTKEGNLSGRQFAEIRNRRLLANEFLTRLYLAAFPQPVVEPLSPELERFLLQVPPENQFAFRMQLQPGLREYQAWERGLQAIRFDFGRSRNERGQFSMEGEQFNRDVVFGFLMGKEADRLGIHISDETVSEFTKSMRTQVRKPTYVKILQDLGVSEDQIYDALRAEIRASEAFRLLLPPTYTTPDEYWDLYKRLTVNQRLVATAVPIEAFTDEVGEPTENDLNVLFDQFRDTTPNVQNPGDPGFLQPSKVRLGYVSIDTSKFDDKVTPPTEAEMLAYYEANKEFRFLKTDFPEEDFGPDPTGNSLLPKITPGDGDEPEEGAKAEGEKPEEGEKPDDKPGEDPAPKPAGDTPEESPAPKPTEPEESDEKKDESGERSARPRATGAALLSVSDDTPESTEPEADPEGKDPETDPPTTPDPKGDDEPTSPDESEGKPPKGDEPLDVELAKPDGEEPKEGDEEPTKPEPKLPEYKPFEEVRDEVRETLVAQRASAAVDAAVDETFQYMRALGLEYANKTLDQDEVITTRELKKRVVDFAKKQGFVYLETDLMSYRELQESSDYEIGSALPLESGSRGGSVIDQFFQGITEFLVSPVKARSGVRVGLDEQEAFGKYRYVVWKLAGVPSHRPLLKSFDLKASAKLDDIAEELGFDEFDRQKLFPRRGGLTTIGEYFTKSVGGTVKADDAINLGQFRVVAKEGGTGFQLYEPGIKAEVTEAWKLQQARTLAEERAKQLAELAKEKPATEMALVFEDETVTGKEGGQNLEVRTTGEFSWYERSTVPESGFGQSQPPRLSSVPGIPNVGETFMKSVFEDLDNTEIGVVSDFDLANYYVVKVIERSPLEPVKLDDQLEEFMSVVRDEGNPATGGDYVILAGTERNLVNATWFRQIEQDRYNVRFNTSMSVPRRGPGLPPARPTNPLGF